MRPADLTLLNPATRSRLWVVTEAFHTSTFTGQRAVLFCGLTQLLQSGTPDLRLCPCAGLLLVYEVIAADMLAGKPGFKGLLCQNFGRVRGCSWTCSRPITAGLLTMLVIIPSVSFRCA